MRYTGSLNTVVWILTESHQRAMFHMNSLGIRETGTYAGDTQRAIVVAGSHWNDRLRGRMWCDGDWVLADEEDEDLDEKLFQLRLSGAPKHPPLRWL